MLFDDRERMDAGPKRRTEPAFAFLNRSARDGAAQVRALLERCYGRIDPPAARGIRGRFRSSDDRAHDGATFELLLHELLIRMGWSVDVEPDVPGTRHSPDFLASRGDERFYLEATVVDPKDSIFATDPLESAVLDAIDDVDSPDYWLSVEVEGKLTSAPSHGKIQKMVASLMERHDPDAVRRMARDAWPNASFEHERWRLTTSLLPKPVRDRGDESTCTMLVRSSKDGMTVIDSSGPVRKAVLEKAGRYGELDAPLLVAVNARRIHDRIDEMEALFGEEQFTYRVDRLDEPPGFSRVPDGAFVGGGNQPRYTRLSGVLIFRGLHPWRLEGAYACLYVHSHGQMPVPESLLRLLHAVPDGDRMRWVDGDDVGGIILSE